MPELPEVETVARGLAGRVTGDVIESVWLGSKKEPLKSRARDIVAILEGRHIAGVHRVGKHIVFELEPAVTLKAKKPRAAGGSAGSTRAQWIVHLGMTGQMLVCSPAAEIEKHTHAIVRLASGRELRFIDPRRFGRLSVVGNGSFDAGGFEPLDIEPAKFNSLFRRRKTPIKSALLNQKLLRGVGNIYADEALFRAGIRPRRRAAGLTRQELSKLFSAVREVLQEAIEAGGSSISDYVDADGQEGVFQLQHRVYGREGAPCLVCRSPIRRIVIAGRSSHYCPKCQK
jgi:formamidopyrimidine-DNA glycosylase